MSDELSAYRYASVFDDLGYGLSELGCIMLDIDTGDQLRSQLETVINPDTDLYVSQNPAYRHICGFSASHVTLLYGLLRSGTELKKHVLTVLDQGDALPKAVEVDHVGYFEGPQADAPHYCIIAHLKVSEQLQEAHDRLTLLPHINVFPAYEAHMTLAFIRKDDVLRDRVVNQLNASLSGQAFPIGALDFGDI